MKGEGQTVLDIVPVDIVVNLLITSAWYTAANKIHKIQIYHCTTGRLNPFRWGEMGEHFFEIYFTVVFVNVNNNIMNDFFCFQII